MSLMPRESAKLIASLSQHVSIEESGVSTIANLVLHAMRNGDIRASNFSQNELHPKPSDPGAADWIFLLDALNFCFWKQQDAPKWSVNEETGYFALCAAVKRAILDGKHIYDPKYYSTISRSDFEEIFRGDNGTVIPFIDERIKNLHEAGKILLKKYKGTFAECVKSCGNSAERLLRLIVSEFESFRDEAVYKGHRVSFYKRAQILVGDIWSCFLGEGLGKFHDIDVITMFADYRIPQVLVHFGALRYTNTLHSKLQSNEELENGSSEEVEIRGCSIEVVERVVTQIRSTIKQSSDATLMKLECNSILMDHYLWDLRRKHRVDFDKTPFHKCKTIYY